MNSAPLRSRAALKRGGCWGWVLLLFAAACGSAQSPPAAQPPQRENLSPEAPRTVRVPLEELPRHIAGLVPIRRTDFNRLWPLYAPTDGAAAPPRVTISAIDYRLSLIEAKNLLSGTVAYHVRLLDERPAAIEIEPAQFTWSNLQWKSLAASELRSDQLVMGAAPDGRWRLLAPHSGILSCNITHGIAPEPPASAEAPGFAVALPAPSGAQARLTLELPDGWVTEPRPGVLWEPSVLIDAAAPAGKRVRRHQAVLTGKNAVAVGSPPGRGPRRATQYAVRESNHYSLLPGRIELETSLELDILRDQLDALVLQLDPGLTVHRIRWGEQALAWSPTGPGERRISVALPEPLRGASRLVQVSAAATWGPAERTPLPRIRVPQALWRQGRTTVAMPPWLAADCVPSGCRLTLANLDPAGQEPDLRQFVFDEPNAKVELLRSPAAGALSVDSGVVFTAAPNQLTAYLRADLRASGGDRFETVCDFAAGWIVESVETQPLNQLESRVIRTEGERQSWLLRWKTPLGDEPMRLLVRARRPGANAAAPLADSDCFPFDFPGAWRHNRWLAVASSDRRQQFLLARAEGVTAAALSELSAPDAERLQGAPSGALVVTLPEISGQPLWIRQASEPAKIGQPQVDLFVANGRLTTRWSVPCRARDELVDRLFITLSPPPAEELTWTLQRDSTTSGGAAPASLPGDVVSRRLAPGELTIPNSAAWELRLQPSAGGDFNLLAEHTQPFLGPVRTPLPVANDRVGGVGQINVYWSSAAPPQLSPVGLTPLLTGESPLGSGTSAPWSYRYSSEQAAGLTLTPAGAIATAPLWCSEALFFSRIDPTGGLQTEVRLQLRGDFSRPLRIQPPAGAEIVAARWSQGESVPISAADALGWRSIALSSAGTDAEQNREASGQAGESAETLTLSLATPPRRGVWLPVFRRPELILACPLAVRREYVLLPSDHLFLPGAGVRPASSGELEELSPLRERFNELPSAAVWAVADSRRALGYGSWNLFRWAAVIAIFATAYLTLRLANRALGGISLAALLLGIASTQLPAPLGLLAEAVAAGAFAGLLVYAWSPKRAAAPLRDASAAGRAALRVAVLGLGCALAASGALFGQPPARNAVAPERLTIVDPINQQLAPAGDYLYVSPKLYDALYLRGQTLDADQPACLIRAARYELRDLPRRENEPRPAPQLVARLELQVREAARRIELPFRRDQLRLGAVEDSRTGQRLAGEWSPAGDFLWIEAAQRGAVSLKLELWPIAAGNSTLMIQIPRCPDAFAELTEAGEWTFLAPRETAPAAAAKGVPIARAIGSAEALRLHLPVSGESTPLPEPEVELITWWKLRENSAAAEVVLRSLRGGGEVRLRVDGALKPLGSGGRLSLVGAADDQGRQTYQLTLGPQPAEKAAAEFILASAPTGLFAPPPVECLGAKVVRSRMLVSYSAELDCQGPASTWPLEQARAQAPELPAERLLAYDLTSAPPPQLTVRGVQPSWSVDLEARWRLLAHEARAEFRCQLAAQGRQPSEFVIDLPPKLVLLEVQSAEAGVATACRWRRQPSGRVAVLLPRGSSTEREVVLSGVLPRSGESCELPAPRFPASQAGNASFLIFRTPNLPVTIEPQAGWVNHLTPPPEFIDPLWGRAALALAPDPAQAQGSVVARCRWEPFQPLLGRQITLLRGGSGWSAELWCDLDSGDQPVDTLAWEIPADWQGRLETSDGSLRLVDQPSAVAARRVLIGQFASPRSGKFSVRLQGKFPLAEGPAITTPVFRLLEHSQVRRLVALPSLAGGELLTWDTAGLRAADRAEISHEPLLSGCQLWEVAEERHQASTSTERRDLPPLRIDWMDVEWSSAAAGMRHLQVELGVVPGGWQHCELAYPGARLLAAAIAGRPARVDSILPGTWKVELLSPHAPQRIELLWALDEQPAESAFHSLALPEVLGGEIARTCIRLRPDASGGGEGISAAAIRPLPLADQIQERLAALAAWRELDRAGEVIWANPAAQRDWWARLQALNDQLEQSLNGQAPENAARRPQIWVAEGRVERIVLHPAARESNAGIYLGLGALGLVLGVVVYWGNRWIGAFAGDIYALNPRWCFLAAAACAWLLMAPLWLPLVLAAVGLLPQLPRSGS